MSRDKCFMLLLFLPSAIGCVDANVVVTVKKNGSGTIRETVFLLPAAVAAVNEELLPLRRQLWEEQRRAAEAVKKEASKGEKEAKKKKTQAKPEEIDEDDLPEIDPIAIHEETLRRRAELMGEGVKLVSVKRVVNEAGDLGREVVFAFTDITKVRLPLWLDNPAVIDLWRGMHSFSGECLTFRLEKGVETKLMIALPALTTLSKEEKRQRLLLHGFQEISEERRQTIRDLLDGFRCRFCVQPEAAILRSNAGRADKSQVVLVELEPALWFDKASTAIRAMMCASGVTLEKIHQNLAGKPGVWIEPSPEVEIVF